MTTDEVKAVLKHLRDLWPDATVTQAMIDEMGSRMKRFQISHEQAIAVLGAERVENTKNTRTPNVGTIMTRLSNAHRQATQKTGWCPADDERTGPSVTLRQFLESMAADPGHHLWQNEWFTDLAERHGFSKPTGGVR